MLNRALFPAVVSVLLLTACPGPPIDPYPPYEETYSYLGAWSGRISDSVGGTGGVTVEVTSQGEDPYSGSLGGSWTAGFGRANSSGILRGRYEYAGELFFDLISSAAPECVYNVSATRTDDTVRGTYLSNGCTPYVTGTLELTKQP